MNDVKTNLSSIISDYCSELDNIDTGQYKDHKFSDKYLNKKRQLLIEQKSSSHPHIKSTGRKILFIIIAAALIGTVTVAAYEPARNFFISLFSDHSVVTANSNSDSSRIVPQTIEKEYSISVPAEYELDKSKSTEVIISKSYYSSKSNKHLYFEQYVKDSFEALFDNENSEPISKLDKNGNEVLIYTHNDSTIIICWDNGDYIFTLSGYLPEEEMMKIYYSLE